jgi:hypothetical protein
MPRFAPLVGTFLLLSALGCGDDTTSATSTSGTGGAAAAFPEKDWSAEAEQLLAGPDWYRHAVFYEVYVRSLQDSTPTASAIWPASRRASMI